MTTMTRWGHSCVRLDGPGGSVVIDPGHATDVTAAVGGAEAILVTHAHQDHLSPAKVAAAGLPVWAPDDALDALRAAGAPDGLLHPLADGDRLAIAGLDVRVVVTPHETIHPDLPETVNAALVVDGVLLVPGDALVVPPEPAVEVLLVPIGGPWQHLSATIDWVRAVNPRLAIPYHDAGLSPSGRALHTNLLRALSGVEVRELDDGVPLELPPAS